MKKIYEKKREWQRTKDREKILSIFRNKLKVRELYRRNTFPPAVFSLEKVDENGILFYYPPAEDLQGVITLYTTVNKHIECDFSIGKEIDTGAAYFHPVELRVGVSNRGFDRIPVQSSDIMVGNIQISKGEIRSGAEVRVTNRIIFNEFQKRLEGEFPGLTIYDPTEKEAPPYIQITGERPDSFVISDTALLREKPAADTDEGRFLQMLIHNGKRDQEMKRIRDKRIRSIVCVPVLAPGRNETLACFTREDLEPIAKDQAPIARFQEEGQKLLNRIIEANTVKIQDKLEIQDLSEKGMSLVVTSEKLMPLLHGDGVMTFDLIFRRQSPIRLQGIIRHMTHFPGKIIAGIEFDGSSLNHMQDKPMDRLKNLVHLYRAQKL